MGRKYGKTIENYRVYLLAAINASIANNVVDNIVSGNKRHLSRR